MSPKLPQLLLSSQRLGQTQVSSCSHSMVSSFVLQCSFRRLKHKLLNNKRHTSVLYLHAKDPRLTLSTRKFETLKPDLRPPTLKDGPSSFIAPAGEAQCPLSRHVGISIVFAGSSLRSPTNTRNRQGSQYGGVRICLASMIPAEVFSFHRPEGLGSTAFPR